MTSAAAETIVVASGTSMFPLIRDGMRVVLRAVPSDEVAVGDIVAFPQDGVVVLHRIVRKTADRWLEKGDNRRVGSWIAPSAVMGKAVLCETGANVRNLAIPANSRRLRLLTWLSFAEGALFGALHRATARVWHERPGWVRGLFARLASLVTAPLRLGIGPVLLSAYKTHAREESDDQIGRLVQLFRSLNGFGTPPDCAGLSDLISVHGLELLALPGAAGKAPRYRSGFLYLSATASLADVARALGAANIRFAVLKGPPLAQALYGDGALRPSVDLDVLVAPADRDRAIRAMIAAGFVVRGSALQQAAVKRGHFHIVLDPVHRGRTSVELHWALVDRANLYRMDESDIRARWTVARFKDLQIGVLSREDELIYLLLHIAKHGLFNGAALERGEPASWFCRAIAGNRLIWFMDVQKHLEKFGKALDWIAIRENSKRWNLLPEIFQSLEVMDRLLPESLAAAALARLGFDGRAVQHPPAPGKTTWRDRLILRWMKADAGLVIRPARLLTIGTIFFPAPRRLKGFYREAGAPVALLYLVHPFRMAARLLSGL